MTPTETLTTWRAEILADIEGLEPELATARLEQTEAEAEYRRSSDAWAALRDTLVRPFGSMEEMAGELYGRLAEERRKLLRGASRRRGVAMANVKAIEGTLAGRRLALRQVARALEPVQGTKIREIVPRAKKSAVVEFDNIVPAKGVG